MRLAFYLIREQEEILKSIGSSLILIFVGRCSFWGGELGKCPPWKDQEHKKSFSFDFED